MALTVKLRGPTARLAYVLWAFACFITTAFADDTPNRYTFDFISNWAETQPNWLKLHGLWGWGIGPKYEPKCVPGVEVALEKAPAYVQMTMQMATTLVTLLPTLLTIGKWNQAKSSEVYSTSFLVGISTAALSFSLPTTTRTGLHARQRLDLSKLPLQDTLRLRQFGEKRRSSKPQPGFFRRTLSLAGLREMPSEFGTSNAEHHIPIEELKRWSMGTHGSLQFKSLSDTVERFRTRQSLFGIPRNFWWIVPILIFVTQGGLLLAIGLPPAYYTIVGWPVYDCTTQAVTWWLLASCVLSIAFKSLSWELSEHEIVKLHLLTELELTKIRKELFHPNQESVEDGIPPLLITYINPIKIVSRRLRPYISWLKYLIRNPFKRFKDFAFAGRRKPAVIMVHLHEEARSPVPSFVSGFVQGFILLCLTFFFGSFWGGGLAYTMAYVGTVLFVAFLGRLLGVFYVMWSAHANAFTVVNCEEPDEVRGVLRLLATTPNVMVEVNQRYYVDGRRIDHFAGFQAWLQKFEFDVHRSSTLDADQIAKANEKNASTTMTTGVEQNGSTEDNGSTGARKRSGDTATAVHPEADQAGAAWANETHEVIEEAARRSMSESVRPRTSTLRSHEEVPPTPSLPVSPRDSGNTPQP
jgi:hypothetical protein